MEVKKGAKSYQEHHPLIETDFFHGNVSLFTEGMPLFDALFQDIDQATTSIFIHFFIVREDPISLRFVHKLIEKAKEGLDVKLSVDYIGNSLSKKTIDRLEHNGVEFVNSRSPELHSFFYSINHRNHRKLAVIDDQIGYIGGFNIGEEYIGNNQEFGYWRDYHLRITGEATSAIQTQFARDWTEDTKEFMELPKLNEKNRGRNKEIKFMFSTGVELENKMIDLINEAKSSITIATPYFIPSKRVRKVLIRAHNQGVKVKLLIPDNTDAWFTKPPSYLITKELITEGIDIYLYTKGFFHGKVMVIDDKLADIGTANWDPRSMYLNDEANCIITDKDIVSEVNKQLSEDFLNSRKLTIDLYEDLPFWEKWFMHTPESVYFYF